MAWQRIDDFTPGIREVISPQYPPGTLQAEGTFRCYAVDGGGLAPLPRRSNNYYFGDSPGIDIPEDSDLLSPIFISGLTTRNPVFWQGQTVGGIDQNNTDILIGLEYFYTSGGTSTKRYETWRFMRHYGVPGFGFPDARTPIWRDQRPGTWDPTVRPKRMSFAHGRSNSASPTVAGPIVTGFCVDGYAQMFPDDTLTTTEVTRYLPGDREDDATGGGLVFPDFLVSHQGRCVIWPLALPAGGRQTTYTNNEAFYFTEPNDWTTKPSLVEFFRMVVGWEQPTGYQVMQSLSADQLILIKSRGGAIMIQGDLEGDVYAVRYPYVRSPGMSMNNGTYSPLGLVYPVDGSGIWLWTGGERSENLTPSMSGDFWRPPPDDFYGYGYTSCETWGDWVVLPNNWLLDLETETPSLWRLDDPEDLILNHHSTDWRSRFLYASSASISGRGSPALVEYDTQYAASSYQARTHPIASSLVDQAQVTAVGIEAQGKGRVTVTVRTRQNPKGEVVVFTGDDDRYPWRQTHGMNITGSHMEFTINAAAEDADSEAPRVHAVLYDDRAARPEERS